MTDRAITNNVLIIDEAGKPVGVTAGALNVNTTAGVATGGVAYPNSVQKTIGVAEADILAAGTYKVVILSAPKTNSAVVFWGTAGVTLTTGIDLNPGEKVYLTGVDCPTTILRGISSVAAQIVIVLAAT